MRFIWSRVCLILNLVCFLLSLLSTVAIIGINVIDFNDLPETDIWQSEKCLLMDSKKIKDRIFYQVTSNKTGQYDLCAIEYYSKTFNTTDPIDCYIPPEPFLFEQCGEDTPIQHLILLEHQDSKIRKKLLDHIIFYWSAWASGAFGFGCFIWFCYSYWFYCCGCREDGYWSCGQARNDYHRLWDTFNFSYDETSDLRFNIDDD